MISAIVVTYHTGPILSASLQALLDAEACAELILVDNGNHPTVLADLRDWAGREPRLQIVSGHGNIGFARGCNLGAQHATQPVLAFVNPDCVVRPQTLLLMARQTREAPMILAGGCIRDTQGREQRGGRRGEMTLWAALVSFAGLARPGVEAGMWRDVNRNREPLPVTAIEMPVVSGALMVTQAAAFQRIGGFDPGYFLHVEDIDLCKRYWRAGGKVVFVPEAQAEHVGGTSQVASWRVEIAKIHSFLRYFWKYARSPVGHLAVIFAAPLLILGFFVRFALKK